MKLRIEQGLLFASANLQYRGQTLVLHRVLLDTGSAGTLFSADRLLGIGLQYEPDDAVHRIRGVGGSEFVFTKRIDSLALAELCLRNFEIEVGAVDYGIHIDGIIGLDFLAGVSALIDLATLELRLA